MDYISQGTLTGWLQEKKCLLPEKLSADHSSTCTLVTLWVSRNMLLRKQKLYVRLTGQLARPPDKVSIFVNTTFSGIGYGFFLCNYNNKSYSYWPITVVSDLHGCMI